MYRNYSSQPYFSYAAGTNYNCECNLNANKNDNNKNNKNDSLSNRLLQSLLDWIVIGLIFTAFAIVYNKFDPHIRQFHCIDADIFFPNNPHTIPFWVVGLYGTVGPILFIISIEAFNAKLLPFQKNSSSEHGWYMFGVCVYHALTLFAFGISITLLITEIGKRWLGRLRPHFIEVCNPNLASITCTSNNGIYNNIDTGGSFCNGNEVDIGAARMSFPSGHSSYSTFTMLFLIIFIQARLVLYKLRFIKSAFQVTAFIAAFVTCISRISDYHHRGSDVIGGIVVGLIVGLFITLVASRVLWYLRAKTDYHDFKLIPNIQV